MADPLSSNISFANFSSYELPQCTAEFVETLCKDVTSIYTEQPRVPANVDLATDNDLPWLWACFAFFTPLCLFGIVGNIITIIMFARYIKRTTTSIFIIALAVVDLSVCSILMPIWIYRLFHHNLASDIICKLQWFLSFFAVPMSMYILLVIAVDRFLLIYLVKTNVMTPQRAKIILCILFVICMGIAIPITLAFSTIHELGFKLCEGDPVSCNLHWCRDQEHIIKRSVYFTLLDVVVYSFMLAVVIFIVLYTLIFCKVYSMHKKMSQWKSSGSTSGTRTSNKRAIDIEEDHLTFTTADEHHNNTVGNGALADKEEKINEQDNLVSFTSPKKKPPAAKRKRLPHLHTALTLFLVTITFVVAYTPLIVVRFINVSLREHSANSDQSEGDTDGSGELVLARDSIKYFFWNFFFLNHITNPIIYSFMNPRFKEAMKNLFFRKWKNRS